MHRMLAAALCAGTLLAVAPDAPRAAAQEPAEQRPTFRSGAHYVRVDAYPMRNGRPIPGLTAADFELLEEGRPQTIENVEYIEHQAWTPDAERRDPNSQRDGFALARDPRYRVFVVYLDAYHVDFSGSNRVAVPLRELLSRMMGPLDLFGVLTPAQSPSDLLLGQLTLGVEEQLMKHTDWGLADRYHPDPAEAEIEFAFPRDGKRLVALRRLDKVYSDLEGLTAKLGDLREERKNIIFFSDAFPSPGSNLGDLATDREPGSRGDPPGIGLTPEGRLTAGSRGAGDPDRMRLNAERARLLSMDFDMRFRDLLRRAREANVSFYTVRPGGLSIASPVRDRGLANLETLAQETDGIAVTQSNDLRAGLGQIATDFSSHYVLGYYTNNTRWDGRTRRITVRLKESRETVRARREYRAPTEEEMAALARGGVRAPAAVSPVDTALGALSRIRPAAALQAYGTAAGGNLLVVAEIAGAEVERGRWKEGAEVELIVTPQGGTATTLTAAIPAGARGAVVRLPADGNGPWQATVRMRGEGGIPETDTVSIDAPSGTLVAPPLVYRAAAPAAAPWRPAAAFTFRRTERVRVAWPVLQKVDVHEARLLDRAGKPFPVPLTVTPREVEGQPALTVEMNLAPLSAGDYLFELTATAGERREQQLVALRVSMAR